MLLEKVETLQASVYSIGEVVKALQTSVNSIEDAVNKLQYGKVTLKDWIDQGEAMSITGLKKSALYELRKKNHLSSSKIGRKTYYRLSEIENMIEEYEKSQ
jgi:predicted DNA-binding transcriptional regulator AlpA